MPKLNGLDKALFLVTALALAVIVIVAGRYIWEFSLNVLAEQDKWGQFGDYFGGVLNPILSFFAFVAILYTLKTQVAANEDGERRHNEQLKEQRFFQLISLMNENSISTKVLTVAYADSTPNEYLYGRQAQHHVAMSLAESLSRRVRIGAQINSNDMDVFESGENAFKKWRKRAWPAVGLFADSVFLILDFVLKEHPSDSFKKFSLDVVRVQLSESERLMVWYVAMFTAEYVVYLEPLLQAGFVDDHEGSLDDQIKPWRDKMIECSRLWSNMEIEKRIAKS